VNDSIKQLLSLQDRDIELDRFQAELAAIPKEIAAIHKQMAAEKTALEDSKKDLVHAQSMRKEKEGELASKEEAVRKHLGELNSIKSNDAYRAMMGEIEKGKQEKSVLEDEILQWMEKVDAAQRAWRDLEATAKSIEGQRKAKITEWETKQKNLETLIAEKQKDRQDASGTLPAALFGKYQRIRQNSKGTVVVEIKSGQCSGCHMQVSQNLMNEIKRGQNIMNCEHCSRIVYLPEAIEKPADSVKS